MREPSPDLEPYFHLHGAKGSFHPDHGPCFVCEGRFLVEEALKAHQAGRLKVISVLTTPRVAPNIDLPEGVERLEADEADLEKLLGFAFHRGLLCAVATPSEPPETELLAARRLVVLPQVDNVDNLGSVLRSAAALGIDAVLAGRGPGVFERRTVRVSMGAAWKLPVWQREDPAPLLEAWRAGGGEVVGAALVPGATLLRDWKPQSRTALLLGPESTGLDAAWLARCERKVVIPMAREMDSLNLAAAGAILMSRMTEGN